MKPILILAVFAVLTACATTSSKAPIWNANIVNAPSVLKPKASSLAHQVGAWSGVARVAWRGDSCGVAANRKSADVLDHFG
jgi:hypothetical protein